MPDDWELDHGLNPASAADRNGDFDVDGYTNLEDYLNDIGAFPATAPLVFNGGANNRYALIENWGPGWQPSHFDSAVLPAGTVVVDDVALFTASALAGDFDLDGDVDGRDFLIWQRNPSIGNLSDWQANYGAPSSIVATHSVPEPGAMALIVQGVVILLQRQRGSYPPNRMRLGRILRQVGLSFKSIVAISNLLVIASMGSKPLCEL